MSKNNKSKYIPTKKNQRTKVEGLHKEGLLEVTRSGMGYVIVEGMEKDILIRQGDLKNAIDGDKVKVKLLKISNNGRTEGAVVSVLQRSQEEFTGIIEASETFGFLIPDKDNINFDIFIPKKFLKGAKTGDKAIAKVTDWGNGKKNPEGKVVELLTDERDNQIAMKEILLDAGFHLRFPDVVMQESEAIPNQLSEEEIASRKDCRDILTLTIDPVDAKDFDDALSIRELDNGKYEIGVHIADVSYYVRPNTELDGEAYQRATSVYLPDRVLSMLPEHISNVLCSLRPDEDKFTFSVIFQMNEKGEVSNYWIGRTVIRSDRRFTYEEAQEIIEKKEGEHKEAILTLNKIAQNIRIERFKHGAINFSSKEIRFQLDEQAVPIGILVKESKAANMLIEEFMLMANKTVAHYVGKRKVNNNPIPFPYRVHDLPDEVKLESFAQFASRFGYKLNLGNPQTIASSFNEMLKNLDGKLEQTILEQLGIRTMAKAVYTTENIGHYGLGFEEYCHFTSPIRRYPDVMVHRIVQELIDKDIRPDKQMELKCQHCSERERKAMEAERSADKYKQVEFMNKYIGDTFDAIISGVSAIGFWAEIPEYKCEGMISIQDLNDIDEFTFVESEYALVGFGTNKRFRIGDKVKIRVERTDFIKRQIDFGYVAEEKPKKSKVAKKKKD
ncbi:MAG TPA: ribonuclease R [Edaphocola sp.]|nr:ribonuclease R [Edaphocola sp.]